MCLFECLNEVILVGDEIYVIDLLFCIECVGYYEKFIC